MFFSTNAVPQSRVIKDLVPGLYRVAVSSIELKDNNSGTGNFFAVEFTIITPEEFALAKFTHRYTFNNEASPKAVEIGRETFADLLFVCQAAGEHTSFDSIKNAITGKECHIDLGVDIEQGNDGREYLVGRVLNCFSIGGKHRNETQTLKEIKLGPNGKKPRVVTKARPNVQGAAPVASSQHKENMPF